ncbi:GNAT family N-acetyltransferase [Endozoicomonadaceae bacterium StTr2]
MTDTTEFNLPWKDNGSIMLKVHANGELIVSDRDNSLALKVLGDDQPVLDLLNRSDLTGQEPAHLLAAVLDYLFTHSQEVSVITLAPELGVDSGLVHTIDSETGTGNCFRTGFYQNPLLWLPHQQERIFPEIWTENDKGTAHPLRPEQPAGTVYQRYDFKSDVVVSFRTIDPELDLELFHQWMNQSRVAEFWEMDQSKEELKAYIQSLLEDRRTWPLVGCFNGEPFGYMEVYWAKEDRIAPYYDCQAWDRGFHLLVGNRKYLGPRYSRSWTCAISHFLYLDDPRTMRLVGEPRADNSRVMKLLAPAAWRFVKEFDFPHKRAALVDCHRQQFFQEVQL